MQKPYGTETENMIDEEVRKLLKNAYLESKKILEENKIYLIKVAEKLIYKEVLYSKNVEDIMGSRSKDKLTIKEEQVVHLNNQ